MPRLRDVENTKELLTKIDGVLGQVSVSHAHVSMLQKSTADSLALEVSAIEDINKFVLLLENNFPQHINRIQHPTLWAAIINKLIDFGCLKQARRAITISGESCAADDALKAVCIKMHRIDKQYGVADSLFRFDDGPLTYAEMIQLSCFACASRNKPIFMQPPEEYYADALKKPSYQNNAEIHLAMVQVHAWRLDFPAALEIFNAQKLYLNKDARRKLYFIVAPLVHALYQSNSMDEAKKTYIIKSVLDYYVQAKARVTSSAAVTLLEIFGFLGASKQAQQVYKLETGNIEKGYRLAFHQAMVQAYLLGGNIAEARKLYNSDLPCFSEKYGKTHPQASALSPDLHGYNFSVGLLACEYYLKFCKEYNVDLIVGKNDGESVLRYAVMYFCEANNITYKFVETNSGVNEGAISLQWDGTRREFIAPVITPQKLAELKSNLSNPKMCENFIKNLAKNISKDLNHKVILRNIRNLNQSNRKQPLRLKIIAARDTLA